jgi:hypothetical protein
VNKESELFYLEKFKEYFSGFPKGNIFSDERPDFLVKSELRNRKRVALRKGIWA